MAFLMVDSLGEDSVYDRVDVVLVVAGAVVGVLLDLVLLLHLVPAGSSIGGEDLNAARRFPCCVLLSRNTNGTTDKNPDTDKLRRAVN